MIQGIGIDVVEIQRIEGALAKRPAFLERILTEAERELCPQGQRLPEFLAGRWAAKEAIAKALGRPLRWHEVEIFPSRMGAPQARLHGRAAIQAQNGRLLVNITHTHHVAAAVAVWESES